MHHNPRDFHACTKTTSVINKGTNVINVINTAKMNVGDIIVIDYTFCYRNKYLETNIIESILAPNVITLRTGVKMRHPSCVNVMCVDTLPRPQIVTSQVSLFSALPESEEEDSLTLCSEHCLSSHHSVCSEHSLSSHNCSEHSLSSHNCSEHSLSSHDSVCSEHSLSSHNCSEHSLSSDEETLESIPMEDASRIKLHKVNHDHKHTGLFSKNFIKLS
jgi:hypothetical protein